VITTPSAAINSPGSVITRAGVRTAGQEGPVERADGQSIMRRCGDWIFQRSTAEALLLLAQGLNHERTAERMGVALNTAVYHVRQLYLKLRAHTREEVIARVLAVGEANVTM